MVKKVKEKKEQCRYCQQEISKSNMARHMIRIHPQQTKAPQKEQRCPLCGFGILKKHLRRHIYEKHSEFKDMKFKDIKKQMHKITPNISLKAIEGRSKYDIEVCQPVYPKPLGAFKKTRNIFIGQELESEYFESEFLKEKIERAIKFNEKLNESGEDKKIFYVKQQEGYCGTCKMDVECYRKHQKTRFHIEKANQVSWFFDEIVVPTANFFNVKATQSTRQGIKARNLLKMGKINEEESEDEDLND